jgi:hypothetical protein
MVHAHSREEGATEPLPPQEVETFFFHWPSNLQKVKQLTGCITAWYDNSTTLDHVALQRVMQIAQHITGAEVLAIQDIYIRQCEREAQKATQATNCCLCFCMASGTGASSLTPTSFWTASIPNISSAWVKSLGSQARKKSHITYAVIW